MNGLRVPRDRWLDLHPLLTLDMTARFAERIGVVRGQVVVRDALRAAMPSDFDLLMLEAEALADIQHRAAAAIDVQAGPLASERLFDWAAFAFTGDHSDQPIWSSWDMALRAWARGEGRLAELEPVRPVATAIVQRAQAATITDAEVAAASQRLSDWDLAVYAAAGWAGSDEIPAVRLGFLSGMRALQQAWAEHFRGIPAQTAALLTEKALEVLATMGVDPLGSLRFPQPEPPPSCL
jgi:hypothetical protein